MCIQFAIEEATFIDSEDFSPHYLNEQVSLGLRPLKRQTNFKVQNSTSHEKSESISLPEE